ncbi:Gfo/Idh/MocA family protein, partial [Streptomyces sp. NPDC054961]
MKRRTIKIAMNGVTGRMGYRQHLVRSLLALREQGGLDLGEGGRGGGGAGGGGGRRGGARGAARRRGRVITNTR